MASITTRSFDDDMKTPRLRVRATKYHCSRELKAQLPGPAT